jgi:hypothetical protein
MEAAEEHQTRVLLGCSRFHGTPHLQNEPRSSYRETCIPLNEIKGWHFEFPNTLL